MTQHEPDALVAACRGLITYWTRNLRNFQWEKADDHVKRINAALSTRSETEPMKEDRTFQRSIADEIIADYKEHYGFPTQGESHMHDCIMDALEAALDVARESGYAAGRSSVAPSAGGTIIETPKSHRRHDDPQYQIRTHQRSTSSATERTFALDREHDEVAEHAARVADANGMEDLARGIRALGAGRVLGLPYRVSCWRCGNTMDRERPFCPSSEISAPCMSATTPDAGYEEPTGPVLAAFTGVTYEGLYPPYINVRQEGSMVRISFRGTAKKNGDMGDCAVALVNVWHAQQFEKALSEAVSKFSTSKGHEAIKTPADRGNDVSS